MAYVQQFDGDVEIKGKLKAAEIEGDAAVTVDEVPTENSPNPVSSGGTFAGLAGKVNLGTDSVAGGDTKNTVVSFTEAGTRVNIVTGEKHKTLFGKIKKWFTDLKAVAFSGSYNDLSDKPDPVLLAGDQTVGGIKTFSNSPVVPAPTIDSHAANFGLLRLSAQGASIRGFTNSPTSEPGVVRGQFSLSDWTDPNKPFIVVTCFAMRSGSITSWANKSFTPMILVRCGSYYEGSGAISFYYSSSSDPIPITAKISITASNGGVNVYVQRPLQIPATEEAAYEPITFIGMTGLYI